jgi:hypothetical protein
MRARFLIALAPAAFGLGLVLAGAPHPAAADDRPSGEGGAYIDSEGDPTATASEGTPAPGSPGGSPSKGNSAASGPPCEWHVFVEDDFEFSVWNADTLETEHSATGRWLEYWCEGAGPVAVDGYFAVPEGGLVDPRALALEALDSVQIEPPAIRTSPSQDGQLYVQVPTWLWLDGGWWRTYEATARAGRVWSTVTARPVSVTWQLGDGNTVTCSGPGTAWTPGAPEDGTDCSHTYRRSSAGSPGGTFHMVATVRLEVSWTSNAPFGGTLPALNRPAALDVEVGEIQAIGTRGGS